MYIKVPIKNTVHVDNEIIRNPSIKAAKKANFAVKVQ